MKVYTKIVYDKDDNIIEEHKELIWYARSLVDQGEDPKQVLHYRPEPKLLKW